MYNSDKLLKKLKDFITSSHLLECSSALLVHMLDKEGKDEYDKKVIRALRRAVFVFTQIMLFEGTPSFAQAMSFASLLDNTLDEFNQLEEDEESYNKILVKNDYSGYILTLAGVHSRTIGLRAVANQVVSTLASGKVDIVKVERIFNYLYCRAIGDTCMYSEEEVEQIDKFVLEFLKKNFKKGTAEVWQHTYGSFLITYDGDSFNVYEVNELPWDEDKKKSKYTPEWAAKQISSSPELQKLLPNI